MTSEQYLQRAQLCHSMAQNLRSGAPRRQNMLRASQLAQRASWLWLFAWVGMFE